jgi:hypothetical protein
MFIPRRKTATMRETQLGFMMGFLRCLSMPMLGEAALNVSP